MLSDLHKFKMPAFLFILIPFIVLAISVAGLPIFNNYVKFYGIFITVAFLIASLIRGIKCSKELLFYGCFLAWCVVVFFGCNVTNLHFIMMATMIQIGIMFLIIFNNALNVKSTKFLLFSAFLGCLIVALSGYLSGEYQSSADASKEGVAGLALNANSFSFMMVISVLLLLFYFKNYASIFVKILVTLLILVCSSLVIGSGSRTGLVTLIMSMPVWVFFSYRKEIFKKPIFLIFTIIITLGFISFVIYKTKGTYLNQRWDEGLSTLQGETGDNSSMQRLNFIKMGLGLIVSNPITGIGLNNFITIAGKYSHNDFIEIFVSTGLIGGFLYYSLYLIWWVRLSKIGKFEIDKYTECLIAFSKSFIIISLVSGMAHISYYDKTHWIFKAILIGWAYHQELQFKEQLTFEMQEYYMNNNELEYQL